MRLLRCRLSDSLLHFRQFKMAPSNSIVSRIRKLFKRVPTWFQRRTKAPGDSAQPSNKVSLPEQPKAAPQQPTEPQDNSSAAKASTMPTLQIALQNQTTSGDVFAYISKFMSQSDPTKAMTNSYQLDKPSTTTLLCSYYLQTAKQRTTHHLHHLPVKLWIETYQSHSVHQATLSP